MRRTLVVGCALVALIGTGAALAHDARYRTSSSFGLATGPDAALGSISSSNAGCVKGRTVKLHMVRGGRDALVGRDRSGVPSGNGDGYWTVQANLRSGKRYYAKVQKKNIGPRGHEHICRGYRTSAVPFTF